MRYWWVNQKKTFRHEVKAQGYLWSPKRKSDGARNKHYEFMREVAPGDVIFSYANGLIKAVGVAKSHAYTDLKPAEFGEAGANWSAEGWRVDVAFQQFPKAAHLRPSEHLDRIADLIASEPNPPLGANGKGREFYLTAIGKQFGETLVHLMGSEAPGVLDSLRALENTSPEAIGSKLKSWEARQVADIRQDKSIPETEREALVMARRGQGQFKNNVKIVEPVCRVTGVDQMEHLRASHCKPWRHSNNAERLDGNNGLLLTPNIDHLFDRGLISFENNGDILISPVAHRPSLKAMGMDTDVIQNVGPFSDEQTIYLQHHREKVFLKVIDENGKGKKPKRK